MNLTAIRTARALFIAMLATLATLAGAQSTKEAPKEQPKIMAGLSKGTYAYFKTNYGEFVAKLFTDLTPKTASNFIGLAEGTKTFIDSKTGEDVKRPYYDGQIFHRVVEGFMIQGGDPEGTGKGGPGYTFGNEIDPSLRFDRPGLLAMAHSSLPNSNGSQFFITVAPYPSLDGEYTIFGEIAKGMDVVETISKVPCDQSDPQSPRPIKPVKLEKVKIYRVAGNAAKPGDAKTTGSQTK